MIRIISFGYGHGEPPTAEFTFDVRASLRNPFHDPELKNMTGLDQPVYDHLLATPGAELWAFNAATAATAIMNVSGAADFTIAFGCVGGRHRSVGLARRTHELLTMTGHEAVIEHRDIERPLLPPGLHSR
ncbi:hypothetical protein [Streptomyces sp. NPDC059957]|uniref:RapZ C-terminal domain-containing protein n=1 Tax=unclassified Streptomyces TaxID=2593676 RepID=UPI00366A2188